ncbi:hypothetical protein PYW07_004707 [Mythimna separata]|uniref:Uncharacterized protein n=1 Tax=Mythimna separata TaxID=271217 RepID=A0AAD7YZN6_MYTSE|nr:hypothetical protein PYW07_004707 [Mythimna separata]
MKSIIVAACIVACVYAATPDQDAVVVRSDFEQSPEGGYFYGYETNNGIAGQAEAVVKTVGKETALEVTGSNSYTAPDGEVITLTFIANENGYQPQGAHLPTPPPAQPIPEYIQKAIEYIAAHPYSEKKAETVA